MSFIRWMTESEAPDAGQQRTDDEALNACALLPPSPEVHDSSDSGTLTD